MSRPKRTAAEKAKGLITRGFGVQYVDECNQEGLSPEEEDLLDELLVRPDEAQDEEDPDVFPPVEEPRRQTTSKTPKSYDDRDARISNPAFKPRRPVGLHICENGTRSEAGAFTRAIDFFKLFFTMDVMQLLVDNSNTYAWIHILDKQSYAKFSDGSWENITLQEMSCFLGLVILMGLNRFPEMALYWSTIPPFSGSWARRYMSRNRFKAILAMMHVSDPTEEDHDDKLCKVRPLLEHFNKVCPQVYQPGRNIAVDERMVKSKGRSGICQYMPQKPVRFGFKLWCACESLTGYTLQFNIYTGKRENPSSNGLAYDVVANLIPSFMHQGYQLWFDNFYTSIALLTHLLSNGITSCGTVITNRKGMPQVLKDKTWAKKSSRGDMRYLRDGPILFQQWMDSRSVTVCSTIHQGHLFSMAKRNVKDPAGRNRVVYVKKPAAIVEYNLQMGAVDLSDQLIQPYNVLLKSVRWWKTLFYHMIDVAIVNSYILFTKWRKLHPDDPALQRPAYYFQLWFRAELAKQLAGISDDEPVPVPMPASGSTLASRTHEYAEYHCGHTPEYVPARRNCKLCYIVHGQQYKGNWACLHPKCNMHLCLNSERNCVKLWHSAAFDVHRKLILESCRHK